jgi:hypothetical protein
MDKLKAIAEGLDILVKAGLAVIAIVFVDNTQKSYELQKQQAELQRMQVDTLKAQAEHMKIRADAESVVRKDDAALVQLIVELLFKQNLNCRTEDQMVLISFLGEMNDSYNKVKLGDRVAGAFGKRRECALNSEAIQADAKIVKTSGDGKIPQLSAANVDAVFEPLLKQAEFKTAMGLEFVKHQANGATGYVALGRPVGANNFSNFDLLSGSRANNLDVTDGSLLQANAPVFVRANRRSTDDGHNPIIGQIADHQCVKTIDAFPNTRGQTWALVRLADCPPRAKKNDG